MIYPERKVQTACIIDDDQIYVFGFKRLLSIKKICPQLIDFQNGQDAIDFLTNPANADQLPDVIFLDINMPVMDGWDFIEAFGEIKSQLGKEITIYMVSSSINTSDITRAKSNASITDYIIKPLSETVLVSLLGSAAA
ncbi:response regulator [Mucilaginibacter koreensis]